MQKTVSNTSKVFTLNTSNKSRVYTTEISTKITQNNKTTFNNIAEEFAITYIKREEENLVFRKEVKKRFFLNEINFVIKKLNKAQELALKLASINDTLDFLVNKHFQIIKVVNTDEIRKKWEVLKLDVLQDYPEFKTLADDFDEQLKEKNIQQVFLEDNFLNLLFSNLFHKEFDDKKAIEVPKLIENAIGELSIPIIEKRKLAKTKRFFSSTIKINTSATIDTENKKFPLAKLNVFIAELGTEEGSKHDLNFDYKGTYHVDVDLGLVNKAELVYTFEIKDVYKKTNTFNFTLEEN